MKISTTDRALEAYLTETRTRVDAVLDRWCTRAQEFWPAPLPAAVRGLFGFLLTATDGQVSGGGGVDKFRIKIWDTNNGGTIVYDNMPSTSDDINNANPQAIGGGSIVIHK